MSKRSTAERYATLAEYVAAKRGSLKKIEIAASLGVTPEKFSKLLRPTLYHPFVSDELAAKIAGLLGQSVDHVRQQYPLAA
jgi:hypothetical protein